ncbi:hypothetical protein F5Y19DRAFT_52081 [Xylariaceae sp. FL1651]|nr:hypothetical protein F5Y19DRAFT_52081 [Xylariaceae sp. FL1651]
MTSIAAAIGSGQLFQLGVGYSDIALLVDQGRKLGNWYRASSNEKDLLDSIGEDVEAVLRRRGLIDCREMERKWPAIHFIYEGSHHDTTRLSQHPENINSALSEENALRLSSLSWLMVPVITALDLCLPSSSIKKLILRVFVTVLDRQEELEESLRVLLPTNIESWRSTGCARGMRNPISRYMREAAKKITGEDAIPQLNPPEAVEMENFLLWLLQGASNNFSAMSAIVFAVVDALGKTGVKLSTDGSRSYETEPIIVYSDNLLNLQEVGTHEGGGRENFRRQHSVVGRAQQIAYPRSKPSSMIHSVPAPRQTINIMIELWELGWNAASKMKLRASAHLPFISGETDVYFILDNDDPELSTFSSTVMMLTNGIFPERSESLFLAMEKLVENINPNDVLWLSTFLDLRHLNQREGIDKSIPTESQINLLWKCQALVFGFYYGLLEPLVSKNLVHEDAYFRGLWGEGSTMFLGMCVEFGGLLRTDGRVSRTHILYMLSTMYDARPKGFPRNSSPTGLLGILGSISILSSPLFHTTDDPEEISKFVLTDLPVLDLVAESNGELVGGHGGGFPSRDLNHDMPTRTSARSPEKEWSLHAKMGTLFGDGGPGVVMAARCAGRLVGWFNPLAADVAFLSEAYLGRCHDNKDEHIDRYVVMGYEIRDKHWQSNRLPRPMNQQIPVHIGLVQSQCCPALRYAAAGIFTEQGEVVRIATDNIDVACNSLTREREGIVIA